MRLKQCIIDPLLFENRFCVCVYRVYVYYFIAATANGDDDDNIAK